jgi:hypothetical protein
MSPGSNLITVVVEWWSCLWYEEQKTVGKAGAGEASATLIRKSVRGKAA